MVLPEKVNVLYKRYDVQEVDNLHDGSAELYGQIHYLEEKILLNRSSSAEQKKATLIHELVHALDEMYMIGLKESHIEKLGNAIYTLIRDNPKLFKEKDEKP